jgi:pSer/pThr/pTyr-binding forkhead associated (FHA) protein
MSDRPPPNEKSSWRIVPTELPKEPPPEDFVSLRLTLLPGGRFVEISRLEAVLGRHSRADVRLPLPDVSRRHCRLFWRDDGWHVADLGSFNGTFLNNRPVESAPLNPGDALRVGGFTFVVEYSPTSSSKRTAPCAEQSRAEGAVLGRIADALSSPDGDAPLRRAS